MLRRIAQNYSTQHPGASTFKPHAPTDAKDEGSNRPATARSMEGGERNAPDHCRPLRASGKFHIHRNGFSYGLPKPPSTIVRNQVSLDYSEIVYFDSSREG